MKNYPSKVGAVCIQFPVFEIGRATKVFQQFYWYPVKCFPKKAKIKHSIIKTNNTLAVRRVRNQSLNLNVYTKNTINIELKYWNAF